MRLDKFLWAVRIYKTRAIAAQACKSGHTTIDGKKMKPSKVLQGNELLIVQKNQTKIHIKIKQFPASRVGASKLEDYIDDLTPPPTSSYHSYQSATAPKLKTKQYREKDNKVDRRDRRKAIDAKLGIK